MKFTLEIYASKDGFRFRLKGRNGEIVAIGESYTRRRDAVRAARNLWPKGRFAVKHL